MWLNKEVRQAINSKKKAFALLKQDGTIEALKNYREKNTLSKKLIKAAKKETEKHIAKESKTNPKLFFNYINSKRIKTENVGPLKNSEERMVVDDEEKANILNTFFSTVFTVENEMLVDGVIMTYMSKFCSAACITASQNLTIVAATETCCTSDLCNNEKLGDVNSLYLGSGGGVLAGGTLLLIAVSGLLSAISAM
ncbi:unnamed protein product [Ranitomeya imitator]|uniref:Snake toxin/toxin-like domain-containing protein n=1 Tax=Ranitomeya imitator TaxID=111125 RepID=A0ABN9LYM0_9NEOB|nr:unnamed protein product [Ranitomeya imitator]